MSHNSSTVGIRMSNEMIEHLKQKARKMSFEQKKNISFSRLVKDAVEKVHPIPKEKK